MNYLSWEDIVRFAIMSLVRACLGPDVIGIVSDGRSPAPHHQLPIATLFLLLLLILPASGRRRLWGQTTSSTSWWHF